MSTFVEAGTHYQSNLIKPHGVRNTSYMAALAEATSDEVREALTPRPAPPSVLPRHRRSRLYPGMRQGWEKYWCSRA